MHTRHTVAARWVAAIVFIVIGLLAGCNSLPRVHPDMARKPGNSVQIEGANGPLSAARSKAIIDALKARSGVETDIFDRHLALEEAVAGAPLVAGNRVLLLQDGSATYAAMFAAIREARDSINMESYIFDDSSVGDRFSDALIAKQREGVQVNLIYDSIGAFETPAEFFTKLSDAGVKVLQYNPVNPLAARAGWNVNQRDHRKLLVVDGKTAFVGGVNISGVYSRGSRGSGGFSKPDKERKTESKTESKSDSKTENKTGLPWRDTHVQIEGPVVKEFQKLFLETWESQKGDPLPQRNYFPDQTNRGAQVVRALGGSPDEPYSAIYATLVSAIDSAETEILMSNAYFAPDPQLSEALTNAVKRGVDVKIILPSKTDSGLIFHAGRSHYDELLAKGVKIYERKAALLHAKTAVIDGVWSTVGSTNLDWRSFLHNQELNAVVLGAEFGTQMKTAFARDLGESEEITLEAWRKRPVSFRMKEALARMWEYWL